MLKKIIKIGDCIKIGGVWVKVVNIGKNWIEVKSGEFMAHYIAMTCQVVEIKNKIFSIKKLQGLPHSLKLCLLMPANS